MFQRLINSLGQPANQHASDIMHDGELQLAAVQLLFAVLPVDYDVTAKEGTALVKSLTAIFAYTPERCHRMIARAASAHSRDSSIMSAATILKARTSVAFRTRLLTEVNVLMRADGVLHDNELDLAHRLERLLGLVNTSDQKIA